MKPLLTSPFPRWGSKWEAQLEGRGVHYGVVLPAERSITSRSFTCNVWDGCWPVKDSDGLARWVETKQVLVPGPGASPGAVGSGATARAQASGESPDVPPAKMQDAAAFVVSAMPRLIESGVPLTIAFRAMAAATQAISRNSARCAFAATLPADQVAFGFLSGALKAEWVKPPCISNLEEGKPPCISNLEGSLVAECPRATTESGLEKDVTVDASDLDQRPGGVDESLLC